MPSNVFNCVGRNNLFLSLWRTGLQASLNFAQNAPQFNLTSDVFFGSDVLGQSTLGSMNHCRPQTLQLNVIYTVACRTSAESLALGDDDAVITEIDLNGDLGDSSNILLPCDYDDDLCDDIASCSDSSFVTCPEHDEDECEDKVNDDDHDLVSFASDSESSPSSNSQPLRIANTLTISQPSELRQFPVNFALGETVTDYMLKQDSCLPLLHSSSFSSQSDDSTSSVQTCIFNDQYEESDKNEAQAVVHDVLSDILDKVIPSGSSWGAIHDFDQESDTSSRRSSSSDVGDNRPDVKRIRSFKNVSLSSFVYSLVCAAASCAAYCMIFVKNQISFCSDLKKDLLLKSFAVAAAGVVTLIAILPFSNYLLSGKIEEPSLHSVNASQFFQL